ncbi:hypothetical protein JX266_012411 [Neoarthrinium moseri]|nr:hypothetical protein JX266_012411 [Neoarthrinium moseri]
MAEYMKPKFVMTPELEAIRAKGGLDYEPWIQDENTEAPQHILDSLPEPDDIPGMAWFLGLDGTMSTLIMRKYQDKYSNTDTPQPYELQTAPYDDSKQFYHFPIMQRLVELYLDRDAGDESDPDESYESYIRGGLTQGLRPEYAIFCGLHESEPRWTETYAHHFYTKSYQEHADNVVKGNWAAFGILWCQRLELERTALPKHDGDEKKSVETYTGVTSLCVEERPDAYGPGKNQPVYLGDVLDNHYHIFRKLESGHRYTVWLARDKRRGLQRKDGKPLGPDEVHYTVAPTPLYSGFPLKDVANPEKPFRLVLTDPGSTCAFEDCEKCPLTKISNYLPPEALLGLPTTEKGDIYSMGIVFWEFVMLRLLVESNYSSQDPEHVNLKNRQLRDIAHRLGPIPTAIRTQWRDAEKFVDSEGNALDMQEQDGETYGPDDFEYGDIWYQARKCKPLDMSEETMEHFVRLVQTMMQWQPELRPSTTQLLQDPWFKDLREKASL